MSDERPRPEYGEYATPEEQARAAGQTYVPPPPFAPPQAWRSDADEESTQPDVPIFNRGRFIDRVVTNGLLLIGVFSFIQSFEGDLSFGSLLKATATSFGVTDYEPSAGIDVVGRWILVINVVLLVASIAVSVVIARRGHLTFYIPLVGFFLFSTAQAILLYTSAPALVEQLGRHFLG
ncbi:MAG TPA: DUF6264 family protein [Galbitalea sp.]|jgi:hypothetical protein